MKIEDLNEFIKHYVEKNKTKSAIMLTAPWGTGKSYYIQNNLLPFLEKSRIQCIVVSLYGKDDIYEISKSIFMEAKLKSLNKKYASKVIAKTIIKGVASFCGIDLSISKKDLQKLYKFVNLSNKLLIFEDLERSSVDILSILGYINNLVEEDGAKVLLVSNESEILKCGSITQYMGNKEKTASNSTKFSEEYLKVKEKTISDTINFYPQIYKAIDNILSSFGNSDISSFLGEKAADGCSVISHEINDKIMCSDLIKNSNLRSLIFGCQKTVDIFDLIKDNKDTYFLKEILLGNIAFSLQSKKNDSLTWNGNDELSTELGTYEYPLYKFCYEYIRNQFVDKKAIDKFKKNSNFHKPDKEVSDNLNTIYEYYLKSEREVLDAVEFVNKILAIAESRIPIGEYKKLASYLFAVQEIFGDSVEKTVDKCISNMSSKIEKLSEKEIDSIVFAICGMKFDSQELDLKIKNFMDNIDKKTRSSNKDLFNFDYSVEKLDSFCQEISKNHDNYVDKRCFAIKIDIEKMVTLLTKCSSKDIYKIRGMFFNVYSFSNIKDFFAGDKEALEKLKVEIDNIIRQPPITLDKIQIYELNLFSTNLLGFIGRL